MILESRAGLAWLHAFCSYSSQGIEPIVYFLMSTWRASTVWKPPPHTQQRSAELRLFKVKGCSFFLSQPLFSIPALSIHAQPHLAKDTADADLCPGVWNWSLNPSWFCTCTKVRSFSLDPWPPGSVSQVARPSRQGPVPTKLIPSTIPLLGQGSHL